VDVKLAFVALPSLFTLKQRANERALTMTDWVIAFVFGAGLACALFFGFFL
jgi:hypothetical protein